MMATVVRNRNHQSGASGSKQNAFCTKRDALFLGLSKSRHPLALFYARISHEALSFSRLSLLY